MCGSLIFQETISEIIIKMARIYVRVKKNAEHDLQEYENAIRDGQQEADRLKEELDEISSAIKRAESIIETVSQSVSQIVASEYEKFIDSIDKEWSSFANQDRYLSTLDIIKLASTRNQRKKDAILVPLKNALIDYVSSHAKKFEDRLLSRIEELSAQLNIGNSILITAFMLDEPQIELSFSLRDIIKSFFEGFAYNWLETFIAPPLVPIFSGELSYWALMEKVREQTVHLLRENSEEVVEQSVASVEKTLKKEIERHEKVLQEHEYAYRKSTDVLNQVKKECSEKAGQYQTALDSLAGNINHISLLTMYKRLHSKDILDLGEENQ